MSFLQNDISREKGRKKTAIDQSVSSSFLSFIDFRQPSNYYCYGGGDRGGSATGSGVCTPEKRRENRKEGGNKKKSLF